MEIKYLSIRNFRGIKEMDWVVPDNLVCLIGAGDTTKTTILDAIENVLAPFHNVSFEDADFNELNIDETIKIDITIGQIPEELLSEQKYGLHLRGWKDGVGLIDEPADGYEQVLTISLQVTKDLEPKWLIINNRLAEDKPISAKDRSLLGMFRLGGYVSRHLGWGTGSVLTKMLGKDVNLQGVLSETSRKIRNNINLQDISEIVQIIEKAKEIGKKVGVVAKKEITANLDIKRIPFKESAISLHDGDVPLRLSGLGTQRLLSIALQLSMVNEGGIGLIDELEYGLEPHRICQLLRLLGSASGQVIITTHAPCVIQELSIDNLQVVTISNSKTLVQAFTNESDIFQSLLRKSPYAFLSKKIIVCEGHTEEGVLRGYDEENEAQGNRGMWAFGVVSVDGGGDNKSINVALQFKALKFNVLWFGDSDVSAVNAQKKELETQNVEVADWIEGSNLEMTIFRDMPWAGVKDLITYAIELKGEQSIVAQMKKNNSDIPDAIAEWTDESHLRVSLGKVSHSQKWFKTFRHGREIGKIIFRYLDQIPETDLKAKLAKIFTWVNKNE